MEAESRPAGDELHSRLGQRELKNIAIAPEIFRVAMAPQGLGNPRPC